MTDPIKTDPAGAGPHEALPGAPEDIGRRRLIVGGGTAIAAGTVAGMAAPAAAREHADGDECLTVLFPNDDGAIFDFDYYIGHHIPLVLKFYGASIRRYEVFRPQPGADGSPPPFIAITNIWISDRAAFDKAGNDHRDEFMSDVPNFTNVTPRIQYQNLAAAIGA